MRLVELDKTDHALMERTRLLLKEKKSRISGVSAGLRTPSGREYYGLCIDLPLSPASMCAEYSAIGSMVTNGEHRINTLVAVALRGKNTYRVLPPCGQCRELARSFGDPYVILETGRGVQGLGKVRLSELVPFPWDAVSARNSIPTKRTP